MKRIGDIKLKPVQLTWHEYVLIARRSRRKGGVNKKHLGAPPLGNMLAINVYDGDEFQDCLFADGIDVCRSHTTIHHRRNWIEVYPVRPLRFETRQNTTTVYYKNNTSLEIVKIN